MKREGNKLSIFKIEKIPIFAHDEPKFGFGDGKKCEKMRKKSIWKEREKELESSQLQRNISSNM